MSTVSNTSDDMVKMARQRPNEIPEIHPIPEYMVSGRVAMWYEETKELLQVPWMGVVTMAFAHYPTFFEELWRGVKPLSKSREFVEACAELRAYVEQRTSEVQPQPLVSELIKIGYAPREIESIRHMNDVFSHGNQPYAIIAAIGRYLLEGGEMSRNTDAEPFEGRHAPDVNVPFILMENHHADSPTREIYEDIKRTLRLPFVNTDYRAFARWPSYFKLAWNDLREVAGTPEHEAICLDCHNKIALWVSETLPNPGGLSSAALRSAAAQDADLAEVREVCRLFQWLLPGLITNVAYLRHQLREN